MEGQYPFKYQIIQNPVSKIPFLKKSMHCPLSCAECIISYLSKTPITPPNDPSPVNPNSVKNHTIQEDKSDNKIDEVLFENNEYINQLCKICQDYKSDISHKLDFIGMDGIYDHNIPISLIFTYGTVPKSMYNHHIYNWCSSANRYNSLNQFKDSL